jgi:vacuolar-type H+-ATPase subunit I/STV1
MPELNKEFDKIEKGLKEQAKEEKDNFATHAEAIAIKEERKKLLDKVIALSGIVKIVKEFDESLTLRDRYYNNCSVNEAERYLENTEKFVKEYDETTNNMIEEKLISLSEKNLHVNNSWERMDKMHNELKARLCMVAVADADTIKKLMLEQIEVESFFTN